MAKIKLKRKVRNPWIKPVISNSRVLAELTSNGVRTVVRNVMCAVCKGRKLSCGKKRCSILVRVYSQLKIKPLIDSLHLDGSSPGIFVGRIGYPHIFVGPLIPPFHGDTEFLNTPEIWSNKSIDDIVSFRSQLVRGKHRVHVKDVTKGKIVQFTREIALSKIPVDTDAEFKKKPSGRIILSSDVQPVGPSAPLKDLAIAGVRTNQKIEKAFNDTDLKAEDAVIMLYKKGVLISKIQTAFSAGLFGIEKNRRFVPTRFAITAVDSIISKSLMKEIREFPLINEFRVYEHEALDNKWIVLMIPDYWSYEQMEGWYPRTLWNPSEKETVIYSDWEGFEGRTTYSLTGGCYYAVRLAIAEKLVQEKRQATVIVFREIHPGYIMPLGVWVTREGMRRTLEKKFIKFNKFEDALKYISFKLDIPIRDWIKNSSLLKNFIYQRKILDFLRFKVP